MLYNRKLRNLSLFSIIIYLFLHFTNQFYSYEELILIGFTDHLKYLEIFDAAKNSIEAEVSQQQAYRFLVPYILGKISNILDLQNEYFLFSAIIVLINFLIIHSFNKIVTLLNIKRNFSLIIISALIFNVYMFRPSIINPILLNDNLFTYGLILITTHLIKKNESLFYSGLILCSLTRQTSQLLNLVFLFIIIYNFIFKKKIKINTYFYGLIINISIFIIFSILSTFFNDNLNNEIYKKHLFGLFYFNYSLLDLIIMIFEFLNAYIFEIILLIFFIINYKSYKKFIDFKIIFMGIIILSIWSQPFLAGPSVTFGNISRLTIISLPIVLIIFLHVFRELEVKTSYTILIILLLGISSFHHNYTDFFNHFFDYKNFHFGLINLLSNFIILMILIRNNYEFKILK